MKTWIPPNWPRTSGSSIRESPIRRSHLLRNDSGTIHPLLAPGGIRAPGSAFGRSMDVRLPFELSLKAFRTKSEDTPDATPVSKTLSGRSKRTTWYRSGPFTECIPLGSQFGHRSDLVARKALRDAREAKSCEGGRLGPSALTALRA